MALDAKKRQEKRVKKATERRGSLTSKKRLGLAGSAKQVGPAASEPIHECLIPERLFDIGIGDVIVSRTLPLGC
ncbi:hypothetical protein NKDENANG_03003 [Candidatus Entotheonellaceae bacterium PAL068K]